MLNKKPDNILLNNRTIAITGAIATIASIMVTLLVYLMPSKEIPTHSTHEEKIAVGSDITSITTQGGKESELENVGNVHKGDVVYGDKFIGDKVEGDKVINQY